MYEQENAFYKANIDILKKQYLNKELVIIGQEIIGVYDSLGMAIQETSKTHTPGTFCIKHVEEPSAVTPFICTSIWPAV
jgi:hypothetical protein